MEGQPASTGSRLSRRAPPAKVSTTRALKRGVPVHLNYPDEVSWLLHR